MTTDLVQQGVAALKAGDKARARQVLAQALRANPRDEQAWLWLSGAVESDDEKLLCLKKVLEINPHNQAAHRGVAVLQQQLEEQAPPVSPFVAPESEVTGAAFAHQDSFVDQDSALEQTGSEWDWGAVGAGQYEPPFPPDAVPPQSESDSVFVDEQQGIEPIEASVLEQDQDFDEDDVMIAQPGSVFVDEDGIADDEQDLTVEEVEASRWKGKDAEPAPEPEPNLFLGIIGGMMAMFIAAALWVIISVLTGWQIGYVAIGVGLLVGFGLRSFAGGASASLGCAGGVLSLLGCLVGNFVIAVYFVSHDADIAQELGYELDFLTMLMDLLSSPALALEFMVSAFDPIDVVFYVLALVAGFSLGAAGRNAGK